MKDDLYEKIAVYCEKNQLFEKGNGVVTGLSGGADSVCLLWILAGIRKRFGLQLEAVHVNHGIRGKEAEDDQEFAVAFARSLGIHCHVVQKNVPELAREWQVTEEEAGRICRYQCFEERRQELGYQKIAVAHHRDDQAETILFQLLRGSGLRGLGGMRPKRGVVVRPLLETERQEIEQFLQKEQISYCTDSTNNQENYTRNRIRHQVLPYLKEKIQPAAVLHISQAGTHLQEVMDYIDEQSAEAYCRMVTFETGRLVLDEREYHKLSKVIQQEVLLRMIQELAGRKKDITSIHIKLIQSVFAGETGKKIMLPYHLRAERSYDKLFLYVQKEEEMNAVEETVVFGKEYRIPLGADGIYRVEFQKEPREKLLDVNLKKFCTKCFDYDRMGSMPIFRYPQEGDFLWLDPSGKKKKLSRLFIDKKVEKSQREKMLVLAEGHHILWIPSLNRCSAYYYISEDTQFIVLANLYKEVTVYS